MAKTEWICTECYEIDAPIISQNGSWLGFVILYILLGIIIFPLTLFWLVFLFAIGFVTKGFIFNSGAIPIFPLLQYLPQTPEIIKICRHCGAVAKMVKLTSREGVNAYEWHVKKKILKDD